MGIIKKILDDFGLDSANEADDEGKNQNTQTEDITSEIDDKVDDLFDNKKDESNEDDKSNQNEPDENGTKQGADDITSTEDNTNTDNDDSNTDDKLDDDMDSDDDLYFDSESNADNSNNEDKSEAENEIENKRILHGKMMYFYDVLTSNIDILSKYNPESLDLKVIETINNIKSNMVECRNIAHHVMVNNFNSDSYVELYRKYVSLKRVYDLSIEMLDRLFKERWDDEEKAPKLITYREE